MPIRTCSRPPTPTRSTTPRSRACAPRCSRSAASSRSRSGCSAALRRWFGRFATQYRAAGELPRPARPPTPAAVAKALADGGRLLRHPHARHAWAREGQRARLHAGGLSFAMGVAAAKSLAAAPELDAAAVARLDDDGRAALHALVAQGHYHLQRPRRR